MRQEATGWQRSAGDPLSGRSRRRRRPEKGRHPGQPAERVSPRRRKSARLEKRPLRSRRAGRRSPSPRPHHSQPSRRPRLQPRRHGSRVSMRRSRFMNAVSRHCSATITAGRRSCFGRSSSAIPRSANCSSGRTCTFGSVNAKRRGRRPRRRAQGTTFMRQRLL